MAETEEPREKKGETGKPGEFFKQHKFKEKNTCEAEEETDKCAEKETKKEEEEGEEYLSKNEEEI